MSEIDYEARSIILEQRVAGMLCKNRDAETPMTPNELLREWDKIRVQQTWKHDTP